MPRVAKKTARPKGKAKSNELMEGLAAGASLAQTAVEEAAAPKSSEELQPPTKPTEPREAAEHGESINSLPLCSPHERLSQEALLPPWESSTSTVMIQMPAMTSSA